MIESVSEPRRQRAARRAPTLDRLPPHSIKVEQGVLGCQLLDPNQIVPEFMEKCRDGALIHYDLRHQTIQDALCSMFTERRQIDLITVQQFLKDKQMLEQVGGIAYLSQLQDAVPSAANFSYYLDIAREKHLLRKLITTCSGIVGKVFDYEGDVESLLSQVESEILTIRTVPAVTKTIRQLMLDASVMIEERAYDWDKILGYSTGLPQLDRMTDGIHGGELITIGAPTSCGKTALALQIVLHNALAGIPVAFLSAEMQPVKLALRTIANEARVNMRRLGENDFPRMTGVMGRIAAAPLHIDTVNGYTISQVRAKARRLKQQFGIKILGIENIQLIDGSGDNREQRVANVSKGMKDMAMELDIAVLGLSQLNDEGRLRESRAIGHDSDSSWVIKNEGEWVKDIQPVELNVEKCRDGETGQVFLDFIKTNTRFAERPKFDNSDVPTGHND